MKIVVSLPNGTKYEIIFSNEGSKWCISKIATAPYVHFFHLNWIGVEGLVGSKWITIRYPVYERIIEDEENNY